MGLAQREIEAAGFSTVILSTIPALTASVSVPRLVGLGYPTGKPFAYPEDKEMQMTILRKTLQAVDLLKEPGLSLELEMEWEERVLGFEVEVMEPPPIAQHLVSHPCELPRLLKRDVPR